MRDSAVTAVMLTVHDATDKLLEAIKAGARLVISEHTVKNHLKNILGKLHLRSRRQAADYGLARGWVRPAEPAS